MGEDAHAAEQRRRMNLGSLADPRNLDPRKMIDPATVERMVKAQVAARVQAQQATTVFLATVVSLITSALGFVAALAWNDAIQLALKSLPDTLKGLKVTDVEIKFLYAIAVTIIAIIVVFIIRGITGRIVGRDLRESEHLF